MFYTCAFTAPNTFKGLKSSSQIRLEGDNTGTEKWVETRKFWEAELRKNSNEEDYVVDWGIELSIDLNHLGPEIKMQEII